MPRKKPLARIESQLRDHALSYPETYEEFPWDHRAIKIKKKVFVFLGLFENILSISVKLPVSNKEAIDLPFAEPSGYGLGKSGWVTAKFDSKGEVPVELLFEWIDESFRAIAPKKIVAQLEAGDV